MICSTERILTTHAGALPRGEELTGMIRARAAGQAVDDDKLEASLRGAVAETVSRQVQAGIDSISDGELSKANFMHYVTGRVSGITVREYEPGQGPAPLSIIARDRQKFPDYFTGGHGGFASGGREAQRPKIRQYLCVEPLRFVGSDAVKRDIANLKAALGGSSIAEAFLPSVTPGVIEHWLSNEHYRSAEEFLYAIADVMREEYLAIVDAGFLLQIDDPDVADGWQMYPDMSVLEYRKYAELRVAALNHALRGIPREKVRIHVCWGSFHGPHEFDLPLKDFVDILFKVQAQGFSIEASNPRHEHEWSVFEGFRIPEGTVLIPGVVGHCTNFIEHPELVAQRLVRYAKLVGRENVMAGTDCGLGNRTATPSICWAKLEAMVEGARLATKTLWGRA
jgi:5-methyltetrahydropteroyltriglutamate--homocysteine methyltransferase